MKERVVVVMPGRGSYGASELGYLARHHSSRSEMLSRFDEVVKENGGIPATELDGLDRFSPAKHLPGRNASNLIYACALADYDAVNRSKYEIVAICGNSLGWYLTLAASKALTPEAGVHLVDTMGRLMQGEGTGGQFLYPLTDENWRLNPNKISQVQRVLDETPNAYYSIDLCGTAVLAGDESAVKSMMDKLPKIDNRFPMRLPKHSAFHTPILSDIAAKAQGLLKSSSMAQPQIPIIDGRGQIWTPNAAELDKLYDYTLNTQIVDCYNFAKSIEVAVKQFAPDKLILAGPGSTLGAPIAQCLIKSNWYGLNSKKDFMDRQAQDPVLIAMGRDDQRDIVL